MCIQITIYTKNDWMIAQPDWCHGIQCHGHGVDWFNTCTLMKSKFVRLKVLQVGLLMLTFYPRILGKN